MWKRTKDWHVQAGIEVKEIVDASGRGMVEVS